MKYLKKVGVLFFVLVVLTLVPGVQSLAASSVPGDVKKLTAKAAETSVKLTWSKVSNAKGYVVYRVNSSTGARKRLGTTTKTSYTVKNLSVGKTYSFQVYAYRKSGKKTYYSANGSSVVRATTAILTPGVPSNFRIDSYGDLSVTLKWSKGSNATGYYIYRYDTSKKEYVRLTKTTKTSYTVSKLTAKETVKFKIQSYRTVKGTTVTGKLSSEVSGTVRAYSASTRLVAGKSYSVTLKADTTVTIIETQTKKKLKKGTKMVANSAGGTNVKVTLTNGTTAKIARSKLKYSNLRTTTKEYSKSVKETFVNEKGYSSRTSYLIWISQYTTNVSVFRGSKGNWKLVRSMPCIVGRMGKTPTGTYRLCRRDSAYGGPRLYFTWNETKQWGNSFHRRVDSNTRGAYSSGCVRLADSDLYYIANNCAMGTTVVSY